MIQIWSCSNINILYTKNGAWYPGHIDSLFPTDTISYKTGHAVIPITYDWHRIHKQKLIHIWRYTRYTRTHPGEKFFPCFSRGLPFQISFDVTYAFIHLLSSIAYTIIHEELESNTTRWLRKTRFCWTAIELLTVPQTASAGMHAAKNV